MRSTLFKNVQLLAPQSPFHGQKIDLLIDAEGVISKVGKLEENESYDVVCWPGQEVMVSAGWMDMEVHLNSPGYEYKESLDELTKAAALGGFTSILCYPNTQPAAINPSMVSNLISQTSHFPIHYHFCGSVSENNAGQELAELYGMQQAGALAFTDGPDKPIGEDLLAKALRYTSAFDGLIINAPLLQSLAKGGQINEGLISLQLGMVPLPEAAETAALLRDIEILRHEGGRMHIQAVSSPEALDILAERKRHDKRLSVGMPSYYLAFQDADLLEFDTNLKVIPPLRSGAQQERLVKHLKSGTIDVLTSGHRAQGLEEKRLEFALADPGMLNLQTFFPTIVSELISPNRMDWDHLWELVIQNPRKLLGIEVPQIKKGAEAELTFFDPALKWELKVSDIPSRGKNSPFIGKTLTGKSLGIFSKAEWIPSN